MSSNVKFYHHPLKRRNVQAIFLNTSRKQISNNYAPCFSRNNFAVTLVTSKHNKLQYEYDLKLRDGNINFFLQHYKSQTHINKLLQSPGTYMLLPGQR